MFKRVLLFFLPLVLFAQNADSLNSDSLQLFYRDSLQMQMQFNPKVLPNNIYNPKLPSNPFEIDRRSSSYYTPRLVSDKLDLHMNRPRSDSFVPVLPVAFIAASIAIQQLRIDKLFKPRAEDYFVNNRQWNVLTSLWMKSAQRIDQLYKKSDYADSLTAAILKDELSELVDKGLVKTRIMDNQNVLFFPAQPAQYVYELFIKSMNNDMVDSTQLEILSKRVQNLEKIITTDK